MTYLRQTITTQLQPYDLYNLNASFRREQRHGLSVNDALIQHLKDDKIHFKINITPENRTRHLFIAYPQSIQLAQTNQDVILVDNTYKTNKFDMPLLHMIGEYGSLYINVNCHSPATTVVAVSNAFKFYANIGTNQWLS
jgi:hypothetical protein